MYYMHEDAKMEYNQKNSLTKIYSASGYGKRGKMNLYLGCKQAAENKKLLKQLGIKVRVPCLHATKYKLRPDHSFVDAKNTCANELVEGWPGSWEDIIAAAEMAVNLLETVGDVLLFCIQGANRSPFIAAIALLLLSAATGRLKARGLKPRHLRASARSGRPGLRGGAVQTTTSGNAEWRSCV